MVTVCILIGHNFKTFYLPRIIKAFEICRLIGSFQDAIFGSVDTLPLFKSVFTNLESYKQDYLVTKCVSVKYSTHDVLADVVSHRQLVSHTITSNHSLAVHSEHISSSIHIYGVNRECDYKQKSMECLLNDKIISNAMLKKKASSGLCLQHLQLAIHRNG